MRKVNNYFVVYKHGAGWGRCEIQRANPIAGIEDVDNIEQSIASNHPEFVGPVLVLSYNLIGKEARVKEALEFAVEH